MKILRRQKSLLKNKNEELKKKNEWQVKRMASQRCIFDKKWLGYKSFKNQKYFKNYFVKEASSFSYSTICNLCGRGSHISDFFPLRKSPHVLQNSKLFQMEERLTL